MQSIWKFVLIVFWLGIGSAAQAQQSNPTVEIVLDQSAAQRGQLITAEVYVRNAVNIIGTDIGITVDPTCLRIIERQTGEFLPIEESKGGMSAFSELHDHDTRLAAALIRRSHIPDGDGVFFRVTLEVVCENGSAPVNVSFVELTGIEDLSAENAKFLIYKIDLGNVSTINAQVAIASQTVVTAVSTQTQPSQNTATALPTGTIDVPVDTNPAQTQTLLIIALSLMALSALGLIILVILYRRRRKH